LAVCVFVSCVAFGSVIVRSDEPMPFWNSSFRLEPFGLMAVLAMSGLLSALPWWLLYSCSGLAARMLQKIDNRSLGLGCRVERNLESFPAIQL
jgi:hypothetical protein